MIDEKIFAELQNRGIITNVGLKAEDYKNLDELKAHYQSGGLGDMKIKKFLKHYKQTKPF